MVCIQESLTVRVFSSSSATLSHTFESGNSLALLFCILTAVLEGWYYFALLEGMTQSQRIAFLLRDCTVNGTPPPYPISHTGELALADSYLAHSFV